MKNKTPILLSILLLLGNLLFGQNRSEGNPFRKENTLGKISTNSHSNIVTLIEHITVPSRFLDQWQFKNQGEKISYDIAREWVESGEAHIEHSNFLMQHSGQKASISSQLESIYPYDLVSQEPDSWPLGVSYYTRNLGYYTQLEIAAGSNKQLESRSRNEYTTLIESKSHHALIEKTRQPEDVFFPIFSSERIPSNIQITDGERTLLGRSGSADFKKVTRLIFQRTELVPLLLAESNKEMKTKNIEFKVCSVIIDHSDWNTWTRAKNNAELSRESWSWVKEQIEQERAQISFTQNAVLGSGKKGWCHNAKEIIYPTEYGYTAIDGKIVSSSDIESAMVPTAFETRFIGELIEVLATRSADSKVVDVKLSLEECKYYGDSTIHRVRDGDQWVPDIQMPIIASVRHNTTVSLAPQRMTLVGAAAALKGDGMVDPSKRVLHFIQVK